MTWTGSTVSIGNFHLTVGVPMMLLFCVSMRSSVINTVLVLWLDQTPRPSEAVS
jgi:hypothetical protein